MNEALLGVIEKRNIYPPPRPLPRIVKFKIKFTNDDDLFMYVTRV